MSGMTSLLNAGDVGETFIARGTSPEAAMRCPDVEESMYAQVLCGLARRGEVICVGSLFASALLRAVRVLETHWRALCDDVRAGRVDDARVTDPACREAVVKVLAGPNPELADAIAAECGGGAGSWNGIVRAAVAEVQVHRCHRDGVHGAVRAHARVLRRRLAAGVEEIRVVRVQLRHQPPAARPAGGRGVHADLQHVLHGVSQSGRGRRREDDTVVDDVDVKVGGYYEIVVTTVTGLYRYRVGDVIQVSGFHKAAPQVRFVRRRNVVLSVDADKTTEDEFHRAVAAAKPLPEPLGRVLAEYTAYTDATSIPGH